MSGRYLLDTNVVIDLFNGKKEITGWLSKAPEVYISTTVIGELYYGFIRSARKKENLKRLESFVMSSAVLDTTVETSKIYGIIKNELRKKGTPIPENDIWIAACAKQHGLTIFTRDSHFEKIKNISLKIL